MISRSGMEKAVNGPMEGRYYQKRKNGKETETDISKRKELRVLIQKANREKKKWQTFCKSQKNGEKQKQKQTNPKPATLKIKSPIKTKHMGEPEDNTS